MTIAAARITQLRQLVRGVVIAPSDALYDDARRSFNGMIDRRPAVIVRPIDALDVSAAVRWAGDADLPIAIRGGGHSVAGHSVADDAVVIDLASLRTVTVNPIARRAEAGGGSQLGDLDRATTGHDLAAPSGTFSDTGIGGLTLSGGISYILGSAGFACDALVGAELVTADGEVRQVDGDRDPELLWALRGGGGNFGVVTQFRYALTKVAPMFGGWIAYPATAIPDVLRLVADLQFGAPDELTLQAFAGHRSGFDAAVIVVLGAWNGDPEAGERAFRPLRGRSDVLIDELRPITYFDLQTTGELLPFGLRHYWKGHFVRELSRGAIDEIVVAVDRNRSMGGMLIEPIHGLAQRIPAESAAFGGRSAAANVSALAIWEEPAHDAAHIAWARETVARLDPYSLRGGGYLNYAPSDEPGARVEAAFGPDRFARLRAVKRRFDPDNRFRFNANIPPA